MFVDLKNKKALITGGGRGIGREIALELARCGCEVGLTYLQDEASAAGVVRQIESHGGRALAIRADASKRDQVESSVVRLVEEFGGIDILITNAGLVRDRVLWKMEEDEWDQVIDVDLKGVFHYLQAVVPYLKEQRSGKIVAVSSINASRGKFGQGNYAAAKAGVEALVKTAARELGRFGINVNAVAPGLTQTHLIESMSPEAKQKAVEEIVLGRVAAPEDIARPVVFLASEGARHITGQVLRVDGGQLIC